MSSGIKIQQEPNSTTKYRVLDHGTLIAIVKYGKEPKRDNTDYLIVVEGILTVAQHARVKCLIRKECP